MLMLAYMLSEYVVLTQNMAQTPSRFSLSNNFSVTTSPVSEEINIVCQNPYGYGYDLQSATQEHYIIPEFKLPTLSANRGNYLSIYSEWVRLKGEMGRTYTKLVFIIN